MNKRRVFHTEGKVKFVRPDSEGYIIPDQTVDGYTGKNVRFDDSVMSAKTKKKIAIGTRVKLSFKIGPSDDLYATNVELLPPSAEQKRELKKAVQLIVALKDRCPKCNSNNIANEGPEEDVTCHHCSHQFTESDQTSQGFVLAKLKKEGLNYAHGEIAEMDETEYGEFLFNNIDNK